MAFWMTWQKHEIPRTWKARRKKIPSSRSTSAKRQTPVRSGSSIRQGTGGDESPEGKSEINNSTHMPGRGRGPPGRGGRGPYGGGGGGFGPPPGAGGGRGGGPPRGRGGGGPAAGGPGGPGGYHGHGSGGGGGYDRGGEFGSAMRSQYLCAWLGCYSQVHVVFSFRG